MKTFLLTFLFCLTQFILKAQVFNKNILDEKVRQIDSTYKFRETLYIIDGIPYGVTDSIMIDSVLSTNGLKHLLSLDILKESAAVNLISCQPIKDVVLVSFVHKQKNSKIRRLLKKTRRAFSDNYSSFSQHILIEAKDPVLYVDNSLIHYSEAKMKLKKLTKKSVFYIDFNDKDVSTEHYGQNAKNGLVRIWTKPE